MEIKLKYEKYGPTFTLDDNFQTFYSRSNEDKRKDLKLSV